jgi:hypothetical protein
MKICNPTILAINTLYNAIYNYYNQVIFKM